MSEVKFNFLNWQPDAEDLGNGGLITADNVLHDSEGYNQLVQQSALAFSTQSPMNAGINSLMSIKIRPFGLSGDNIVAAIYQDTATTSTFRIGVAGQNAFTSVTLATLSSLSAARIKNFSSCELAQSVIMAAQAEASLLAGGVTTYALAGTFVYTITSV